MSLLRRVRRSFIFFEALPGALFVVDDAATIVYANASAQAMPGATREDVCGKSLWCYAPHLVSTSLYQAVQKTKQTREPTEVEYISPVTNTWQRVSLSPIDEGLAIFFHHHLEREDAEDELRTLVDAIPDFVWMMRPDGLFEYANQRWCDYISKTREQIQGDTWLQFTHPDDRSWVQEAWQTAVRTGTPYEVEHRI